MNQRRRCINCGGWIPIKGTTYIRSGEVCNCMNPKIRERELYDIPLKNR